MIENLLAVDAKYSQKLRVADRPGFLRRGAMFLAHSGDSWFWLFGLVMLLWLGTSGWKYVAFVMIVSLLVTAVLVLAIKFLVRRQRPEGQWGDVYRKTDPHSFPSGHAARAALLAVLAIGLAPAWFGWLLGIWAPLVIFSRVAMGVHYLSDVIVGALFGIAMGLGILYFLPQLMTFISNI